MNTAVLILAAGASTRMGEAKQLLPFGGTSLLGHVVDAAKEAACGPLFVVLGANAAAIRASLQQAELKFVVNDRWAAGIGSSIGAGIAAVQELVPEAVSALILLGDQPLIDPALIRSFASKAAARPESIVAASYDGTVGVPAVFPAQYFAELLGLDPSKGAKPLLERYAASLELIALAANPDVDTPEDYRRLIG